MPYKNKEDRTAAVRRHREKKKGIADAMVCEAELRDFLRKIGFVTISWDDLAEITHRNKALLFCRACGPVGHRARRRGPVR